MNDKELQIKSINLLKKIQELIEDQHPNVQTEALCRALGTVIVINCENYKSVEDTLDKFNIILKRMTKEAFKLKDIDLELFKRQSDEPLTKEEFEKWRDLYEQYQSYDEYLEAYKKDLERLKDE